MAPEAHRRVKRKMLPLKYSNSSLDLINITLRCTRPLHFSPLKKYLKAIYRKKPHLICLNIFAPLTDLLFYYTVNNLVLGDAKLL